MSFFHSQNVIDPEFFFPAFYDETVCIKQEDDCKDSDHTDLILQRIPGGSVPNPLLPACSVSPDCFLMRT